MADGEDVAEISADLIDDAEMTINDQLTDFVATDFWNDSSGEGEFVKFARRIYNSAAPFKGNFVAIVVCDVVLLLAKAFLSAFCPFDLSDGCHRRPSASNSRSNSF